MIIITIIKNLEDTNIQNYTVSKLEIYFSDKTKQKSVSEKLKHLDLTGIIQYQDQSFREYVAKQLCIHPREILFEIQ